MDEVGWAFVIVTCGALPWLAVRTARRIEAEEHRPTVGQILVSTAIGQSAVAALALWAAWSNGIDVLPPARPQWRDALLGAPVLVGALAVNLIRWKLRRARDRRRMAWLGPQHVGDAPAWLAIALIAGISEEIIYRGVLFELTRAVMGGWWGPAFVCVIAFALCHWVQGWSAMAIIVGFAFGFHVLVRVTGDLYTAMAVHVLYDFTAGWLLLWLARREFGPGPI